MQDYPLVSVIIPSLNRRHFIEQTIESVLEQSYPNIECIVIDGGSTDGTVEILKKYESKISWISEPDNGHVDAINKGWKMSKGEILAWLNVDDYYVVPDAVSKAMTYFKNQPDTDLIYGDCSTVSEKGKVISELFKSCPWDLEYAVKYCYYTVTQATSFIRRSVMEKVDWLDPEFEYCKDHELWLRIGLVGKIRYIPEKLAFVRIGSGISLDPEVSEAKVRLTKKFFTLPNLPKIFRSKGFQRRAISNAHSVGSNYAWSGRHFSLFIKYLFRAIIIDPVNLPFIAVSCLSYIGLGKLFPGISQKTKKSFKKFFSIK